MLDEAPFAGVFPYVNKSCHKVIKKILKLMLLKVFQLKPKYFITQNGNRNESINQNLYLYMYVAWRALLFLTSLPLYFSKTPIHQHFEKI